MEIVYMEFGLSLLKGICLLELTKALFKITISIKKYFIYICTTSLLWTTFGLRFSIHPIFIMIHFFFFYWLIGCVYMPKYMRELFVGQISFLLIDIGYHFGIVVYITISHRPLDILGTFTFLYIQPGIEYLLLISIISLGSLWYRKRNGHALSIKMQNLNISSILILLMFSCLITFNLYYVIYFREYHQQFLAVEIVLIINIFFMICYVLYLSLALKRKELYANSLQYYIQSHKLYNQEIKLFKHDFNNFLLVLEGYIDNKQWSRAKGFMAVYRQTPVATAFDKLDTFQNLQHPGLIKLLAIKLQHATDMKVKLKYFVPFTIQDLPINEVVLIRVLGVFIDNALEAASQSAQREVILAIKNVATYCQVEVINSTDVAVDVMYLNQYGYSRKENGNGLGLFSVDKQLKAFDNIFWDTSIEEKRFIQRITVIKEADIL